MNRLYAYCVAATLWQDPRARDKCLRAQKQHSQLFHDTARKAVGVA